MSRTYRRVVKALLRAGFCNIILALASVLALVFVAQMAFRLSF